MRPDLKHPGIRLAVASALLFALLRWILPPADLLAAAAAAQPRWLLLAASLTPIGLLIQWWKWRRLVQAGLPGIGEGDIVQSLFTGFGLGLLTPGRLGELGRAVGWQGDRLRGTMLATADRLVSSFVTLWVGALGALYVAPVLWGMWAVGAGAVVGLAWYRFGHRIPRRLAPWRRLSMLTDVGWQSWVGNASAAVLFNLLFFLQMFCLLRSTGPVPEGAIMAIPAMFALKTLLPISLMDLGVREGAAVGVLGTVGVGAATAVHASLMLFCLNVLAPGVVGLLVLSLVTRRNQFSTHPKRVEFAHVR